MGRHLARVERRGRRLVTGSALRSAMRLDLLCLGHNFIVRYFPHSVRHQFKPHNDSPLLDFSIIQQTVRHCGRNHPHGRAAGQPCARYGGAAGGWGQASHGRRGATIYSWLDKRYWRLQVPHTYAFRCIWQRQFPAPVLCAGVHHADLLIRWLARAAGGMTGCVRHCGSHDADRSAAD